MRYFLFLIFITIFLNAASFQRDNGRNVVTDNEHNLMWMDGKENVTLEFTHQDADDYCANLTYAGFKGWRLPEIEEFEYIVDKKTILQTSIKNLDLI